MSSVDSMDVDTNNNDMMEVDETSPTPPSMSIGAGVYGGPSQFSTEPMIQCWWCQKAVRHSQSFHVYDARMCSMPCVLAWKHKYHPKKSTDNDGNRRVHTMGGGAMAF